MIKNLFSINNRINERRVKYTFVLSDIVFICLSHLIILQLFPDLPLHILNKHLPILSKGFAIPLFFLTSTFYWVYNFYLFGAYTQVDKRSGLSIIWPSFLSVFSGSTLLLLLLIKTVPYYVSYFQFILFIKYLSLLGGLIIISRVIWIQLFQKQKRNGNISYNTILIGNNERALAIIKDFLGFKYNLGFKFIGYVSPNNEENPQINNYCKHFGNIDKLSSIINKNEIDEAVVCLDPRNHEGIYSVITLLKQSGITIRLNPDINLIIEGAVKTNTLETLPFVTITPFKMPVWQGVMKRFLDFSIALLGLLFCAPIFLILALLIKQGSNGPIFYAQKRIGKNGKVFTIYKFRSMYINAEESGPCLAKEDDVRITKLGRYMRKWRIDELPQFINIVMGDMSLVGPRPERQFFIDQITEKAPHYAHILTVKPGITSWGMVKFGYAQNINEMIERLQFDLLYLENQTLLVDFKIILFTVRTVLAGEGK